MVAGCLGGPGICTSPAAQPNPSDDGLVDLFNVEMRCPISLEADGGDLARDGVGCEERGEMCWGGGGGGCTLSE